jgi:hypothetical protein
MATMTLQFEGRVLKEFTVGSNVTIGRLPDNMVIIDNPAVSGHHARVFREGDQVIVEDLKSTNGTFVNGRHVYRHSLRNGDVVLVGKHTLVFDRMAFAAPLVPEPVMSGLGDTMYLDTRQHRTLLATLRETRAEAEKRAGARPTWAPAPERIGVLRVVSGRAEQPEYDLQAHTSFIGKSTTALVKLRGWFKPEVAVAIAWNADGYVATAHGGRTRINDRPLNGRHRLKEGDVLHVSGLTLEFGYRAGAGTDVAPVNEGLRARLFMSSGERAATVRALT